MKTAVKPRDRRPRASEENINFRNLTHFPVRDNGPASEGVRNDEAQRRVDLPAIRAELLALYGGEDDDGFLGYLKEHCYDLHYAPTASAQPFSFGLGNLWRIAIDWPGRPVPPCIHRAPETTPGQPPRLLLIS